MSSTTTDLQQLKLNRGAIDKLEENLSEIGTNELILVTDKTIPIPTEEDSGKVLGVDSNGDYELKNPSSNVTVSSSGVTDGTNTYNASDKQPLITDSNKLPASKVSGLSTVATSGSYDDLTNKPALVEEVIEGEGSAVTSGAVWSLLWEGEYTDHIYDTVSDWADNNLSTRMSQYGQYLHHIHIEYIHNGYLYHAILDITNNYEEQYTESTLAQKLSNLVEFTIMGFAFGTSVEAETVWMYRRNNPIGIYVTNEDDLDDRIDVLYDEVIQVNEPE